MSGWIMLGGVAAAVYFGYEYLKKQCGSAQTGFVGTLCDTIYGSSPAIQSPPSAGQTSTSADPNASGQSSSGLIPLPATGVCPAGYQTISILGWGGGQACQPSSSQNPSAQPPSVNPYALAIAHLKAAAGGNSENYDQWAWYWENSGTFPGAPNGFGVTGAATSPSVIAQIITAGGGGNAANNWAGRTTNITAEQFVQDLKQAQGLSGLTPYAEIGIPSWMIHGGYHA